MARRDITPPLGIRMRNWGYGDADIALSVHHPITLTALAVDGPDRVGTQLLITADLGWWRTLADERQVRGAVLQRTGLAESNVLFHLTHTHAGPSICAEDADLPGGEHVVDYLAFLADRAAEAAAAAIDDLGPGTLQWAHSSCAVAAVRDVTIADRALLGFDPRQTHADETVLVGRAAAADGRIKATLVNYACHPTSLGWANSALSPDFPAAMRTLVEAHTNAPCLFLQGASGDLGPRVQYGDDLELTDRYGTALGHAVLAALGTLDEPGTGLVFDGIIESGAPLGIWTATTAELDRTRGQETCEVPVQIKELSRIEDLETEWSDIDPRARAERLRRARRLRSTYADMSDPHHPVWVWRWGGAVIVAHPGEAYSALQVRLRERFPQLAVVVLNLTNAPGWVYLPTREAYQEDRYQSWQTLVRPGALEAVIDAAADLVTQLT